MSKVIIYSTPSCVYCKMAKEFFAKNSVQYEEFNVGSDLKAREEMVAKSHQLGVPVIVVGNDIMVGFDRAKLAHKLGIEA